jgi:uncharacterized phage-like protein YoqJ
MIVAATGHRPPRMGNPDFGQLTAFATSQIHRIQPSVLMCGLAMGWDLACGIAAIRLGIPVWAISPFTGQADRWPIVDRKRRDWVIDRADFWKEIYKDFRTDAFVWRNIWMVNDCDAILALYSGIPGGTDHCVKYAISQHRTIHNVWDEWNVFQK